jgi:hypothetical protein
MRRFGTKWRHEELCQQCAVIRRRMVSALLFGGGQPIPIQKPGPGTALQNGSSRDCLTPSAHFTYPRFPASFCGFV